MKRTIGLFIFAVLCFFTIVLAGGDSTTVTLKDVTMPPIAPPGFNFLYIPIFAFGMVLHFIVRAVRVAGGWSKFFSIFNASFIDQFIGWFGNKFHLTLVTTAAGAILALTSQYELNINFAVINALGVTIAIVSGYIGDSAFNSGTTPEKQV